MGIWDQAGRYSTQAEPQAVVARLLRETDESLSFGREFDTRTNPIPGHPERTADYAAVLTGAGHSEEPVLLVFEFQSRHDPDKLDTTFLEAGLYRNYARHGPERKGKFNVQAALIYLKGACPERTLNMGLGGGSGSRHTCLVWNVAADSATTTLDDLSAGHITWGNLFWLPLLAGGGDATVIARWKEMVAALVADRRLRSEMAGIAWYSRNWPGACGPGKTAWEGGT